MAYSPVTSISGVIRQQTSGISKGCEGDSGHDSSTTCADRLYVTTDDDRMPHAGDQGERATVEFGRAKIMRVFCAVHGTEASDFIDLNIGL